MTRILRFRAFLSTTTNRRGCFEICIDTSGDKTNTKNKGVSFYLIRSWVSAFLSDLMNQFRDILYSLVVVIIKNGWRPLHSSVAEALFICIEWIVTLLCRAGFAKPSLGIYRIFGKIWKISCVFCFEVFRKYNSRIFNFVPIM